MTKRDYPTDGDDLMFERIFLAVEHRHLNLDPTLDEVTDDLQVLAKFLIRRQQLIGPYGLSARTNLGSGAWREYRAQELERLRLASETEGDLLSDTSSLTPMTAAPLKYRMDPRLCLAQPGQFADNKTPVLLMSTEEEFYRGWNKTRGAYGATKTRSM